MPIHSGISMVELGEKTSVWSIYLAGTVTETFLSKTESQIDDTCTARFNRRPLRLQPQVFSN